MVEESTGAQAEGGPDLVAIGVALAKASPAVDAELIAYLRKALSRARSSSRSLESLGGATMERIKNLNLSFSPDDLAGIANARTVPLTGTKVALNAGNSTSTICGPIGAVPATYGQGQFSFLPAAQGDMVKAIPDFSGGGR